jgi:hypothetical protein
MRLQTKIIGEPSVFVYTCDSVSVFSNNHLQKSKIVLLAKRVCRIQKFPVSFRFYFVITEGKLMYLYQGLFCYNKYIMVLIVKKIFW